MKKKLALMLAGLMTLSLVGCGGAAETPATPAAPAATEAAPAAEGEAEAPAAEAEGSDLSALIEAAKAEGTLVVYGSCEEEYLAAACNHFKELYGIDVQYQRLSTGEVQSKIEEV